jgi:hypothetical protein
MTNQIRNPNDRILQIGLLCVASIVAMIACWWAAGNSLGLFFGGLFVVTFLTPAAVLQNSLVSGGAQHRGFAHRCQIVVAPIE